MSEVRSSINHSFIQAQITGLFFNHEKFTPFVELSLDASQVDLSQFGLKTKDELIPDVCLYEGVHQFDPLSDASKRRDMPVLTIEIIFPSQGTDDLLAKFKAYFALGVKSCWLVIPANEVITVYSAQGDFESFGSQDAEVIDKMLDIRLPKPNIFGKDKRGHG